MRVIAKLTRREIVAFVTHLRLVIGDACDVGGNESNPNRARDIEALLREAMPLCFTATSGDATITRAERIAVVRKLKGRGR